MPAREQEVAARILEAAFEQFCQVGIKRSSIEDVARRARLGRGTIYRRFPNKDRLVAAVIRRQIRSALAVIEATARDIPDDVDRLVERLAVGIGLIQSHRLLPVLLENEPETVLPLLTVHGGAVLRLPRALLSREFRRLQALPSQSHDDAAMVAEILARITHSWLLTTKTHAAPDREQVRRLIRRHLLPMVAGICGAHANGPG